MGILDSFFRGCWTDTYKKGRIKMGCHGNNSCVHLGGGGEHILNRSLLLTQCYEEISIRLVVNIKTNFS